MNVPKLRFKDDDGREFPEWQIVSINDADVKVIDGDRGTNYPNGNDFSSDGYCLFLNAKNVTKSGFVFDEVSFITKEKDEKLRKGKLRRNDLIITTRGSVGNIAFYNNVINFENVRINSGMVILRIENSKIEAKYLYQYFYSPNFTQLVQKIAFGSAQPQLTVLEIKKFTIGLPLLQEQTKIANFLTAVDEKITQLTQKSDLLAQYKKGVMQKIFSQELRFKDDDEREFPEWEEVLLKDIAERVKTKNKENNKNVLTISAQQGLINQEKYFNKSVAAKDLTNYYLLHKGDFAYNKSYSNGYPMGAIKCLNLYEKGVVSTLYICFKFHADYVNAFFEQYFATGLHNKEIEKVAQEGARNHGLLNISLDDFFNISLTIPSIKEQTKIANFLTTIDDKITQTQAELDAVKQYKQGLLQQMFV